MRLGKAHRLSLLSSTVGQVLKGRYVCLLAGSHWALLWPVCSVCCSMGRLGPRSHCTGFGIVLLCSAQPV